MNRIKEGYGSDLVLTNNNEKTIDSIRWYIIEGTYSEFNYTASYIKIDEGLLYIETLSKNNSLDEIYKDMNELYKTIHKSSTNHLPNNEQDSFGIGYISIDVLN